MEKNITETIKLVENNVSSIFSKEDVLILLNNLTIPEKVDLKSFFKDEFKEELKEVFEGLMYSGSVLDLEKIIDLDSANFELESNNEITLKNVEINVPEILKQSLQCLDDAVTLILKSQYN